MDKITKHIVAELTGYKLHTMDVSQGDRRSRQIRLRLLENGIPWSAPEGARVVVSYQLPDGTPGSYDTMPDGSPAGAVERNVVTAQLADQLTTQAGAADISVVLLGSEGQQLAMWPVRLRVVGPEKLTIPENLPALGAGYEERLLFGGEGGVLQPLEIGTGLYIEDDTLHAKGGSGGGGGYVASDEPPENTKALWVDTAEPEEAVALGVTAVETAEGVDLYCTDELGTTKVTVRHGKDGAPGDDGITPHIGDNGNWWIGETDTGIRAQGPEGDPGRTPIKGTDYFTPDEVQSIAEQAAEMVEIPGGGGGGGGGGDWTLLFDGTIEVTEPVRSITASLLASCEGMTEIVVYGSWTANESTESGNDNAQLKIGRFDTGQGGLGDMTYDTNVAKRLFDVGHGVVWTEGFAGGNSIFTNNNGINGRLSRYVAENAISYDSLTIRPFAIAYQGSITLTVTGR